MDTVDLPSHTLSISATHLLHTLLITWLVSLTAGRSEDKETSKGNEDEKEEGKGDVLWRPFIVNGLQQTIVDGLACLLVSVPSKYRYTYCVDVKALTLKELCFYSNMPD